MIEFKVGIMGAGEMSGIIADTLNKLDGFQACAVAAREEDRAKAFAEKYGISKAYGSYEELAADPEVELIYVGTVTSAHADCAKICLNAGKPCLVERPISYNTETAAEVLKLAEEKKIFCGEAMALRYMPIMGMILDHIQKKEIGDIRYVMASIGTQEVTEERVRQPELAGGALLSRGIDALSAVFMVMGGPPLSLASAYSRLNTGVDAADTIQMSFQHGRVGTVYATALCNSDNRMLIYGTAGRIEVENIGAPTSFRVYNDKNEMTAEEFPPDNQINGYEYELLSARKAAIVGRTETPLDTNMNIVQLLTFTDMVRRSWNVIFPLPEEPKPMTKEEIEARQRAAALQGRPAGPAPGHPGTPGPGPRRQETPVVPFGVRPAVHRNNRPKDNGNTGK